MKKKLRLQIEKLRVEPFDVETDSPAARGTVHAFDSIPWHSYTGAHDEACICFPMPDTRVNC